RRRRTISGPRSATCSTTGARGRRCWPGPRPMSRTTLPPGARSPPNSAVRGCSYPRATAGPGGPTRKRASWPRKPGALFAPVPCPGSAVVAPAALLGSGEELLKGLAEGQVTAALAVGFGQTPIAGGEGLATAVRVGGPQPGDPPGQARLTGTAAGVADALLADVLLVPGDGVPFGLYAVDAGAPGVRRTPVVSLDATRPLCDVAFEAVPARTVAPGAAATQAVASALAAGAAMLACEQLGTAQRCLDMTVAYVKERRQFARPVGSFQALKHRLADVWVQLTQARAAARYAAACLADGHPDTPSAIARAQAAS